ncbi:hypothetical protein ABT317_43575, partial [Streptomyces carpinensis]
MPPRAEEDGSVTVGSGETGDGGEDAGGGSGAADVCGGGGTGSVGVGAPGFGGTPRLPGGGVDAPPVADGEADADGDPSFCPFSFSPCPCSERPSPPARPASPPEIAVPPAGASPPRRLKKLRADLRQKERYVA